MRKQEIFELLKVKGLIVKLWVRFESVTTDDIIGEYFTIAKSELKRRIEEMPCNDKFMFKSRYYEHSKSLFIN